MINETQNILPVVGEIKQLIAESRQQVAVAVNAAISMLYWRVGKRIREEILNQERADYGKQIVNTLSAQLTQEYGKGWSEKQLRHCLRFAETIQDEAIVSALRRQFRTKQLSPHCGDN
jgi:hypothetical protein